jgi:hypothetical protein
MFLQFQRQLLDAAPPGGDLGPVAARTHFRYLPPAGVIPVPGGDAAAKTAAARFFAGMTCRGPTFIDAARVEALVRESLTYPPVDTQGGELVRLYHVRENRAAVDRAGDAPGPRAYLVFASAHLPDRADARFDVGAWDYANHPLAR